MLTNAVKENSQLMPYSGQFKVMKKHLQVKTKCKTRLKLFFMCFTYYYRRFPYNFSLDNPRYLRKI